MPNPTLDCGRRSRRKPVLLSASVDVDGIPVAVKLRNLSEEGALIEGERLPAEGSATYFQRDELRLSGTVVWVQGPFAGLAFTRKLESDEVLRYIPKPRARALRSSWRPGFVSRPLTPAERKLLESWATEALVVTDD